MPGRNKQPIDLIKAKGKSHLSKAVMEERKAEEIQVPFKDINPPPSLNTKARKDKFFEIAAMMSEIGIWTELDEDCLVMFVIAMDEYSRFTRQMEKEMKAKEIDWKLIDSLHVHQNTSFKQAMTCASKLGLTITDRCRLIAPKAEKEEKVNRFAEFGLQ